MQSTKVTANNPKSDESGKVELQNFGVQVKLKVLFRAKFCLDINKEINKYVEYKSDRE